MMTKRYASSEQILVVIHRSFRSSFMEANVHTQLLPKFLSLQSKDRKSETTNIEVTP